VLAGTATLQPAAHETAVVVVHPAVHVGAGPANEEPDPPNSIITSLTAGPPACAAFSFTSIVVGAVLLLVVKLP
jgi:hypothetical protein